MEVVELDSGCGVLHAGLGCALTKVAVHLEGIGRGAKVGVDGVGTTGGLWVLQLDIEAGAGRLAVGEGEGLELILHAHQLNKHELLERVGREGRRGGGEGEEEGKDMGWVPEGMEWRWQELE